MNHICKKNIDNFLNQENLVTHEMIDAGLGELINYDGDSVASDECLAKIYLAMVRARLLTYKYS